MIQSKFCHFEYEKNKTEQQSIKQFNKTTKQYNQNLYVYTT